MIKKILKENVNSCGTEDQSRGQGEWNIWSSVFKRWKNTFLFIEEKRLLIKER